MVRRKEYPEQKDVKEEEPRIGVFVCRCGNNIAGVVDVPGVKDYAGSMGNVVYAEENLYTCSQDTQEKIKKAIEEHKLNIMDTLNKQAARGQVPKQMIPII